MILKASLPVIVGLGLLVSTTAAAAEGDPATGKRVFNQCQACHTVVKGKNGLGPSLNGVVGRKAGTADGFKNYSPAMQKSDVAWTEENLDKYLSDPKGFLPGNRMIFVGLKKDQDRADVIAFIKQQSAQ